MSEEKEYNEDVVKIKILRSTLEQFDDDEPARDFLKLFIKDPLILDEIERELLIKSTIQFNKYLIDDPEWNCSKCMYFNNLDFLKLESQETKDKIIKLIRTSEIEFYCGKGHIYRYDTVWNCEHISILIPKEMCHKCGKGIFHKVVRIVDEGKTSTWNDKEKRWKNQKYYHPKCVPNKQQN